MGGLTRWKKSKRCRQFCQKPDPGVRVNSFTMKEFMFFLTDYARLSAKGHTRYFSWTEALRVTLITFDMLYEAPIRKLCEESMRLNRRYNVEFLLQGKMVKAQIYWDKYDTWQSPSVR